MPKTIISCWDVVFTSRFWKKFFRLQKVSLLTSTGYHPQIDGRQKWSNMCLDCYLRYMRSLSCGLSGFPLLNAGTTSFSMPPLNCPVVRGVFMNPSHTL